MKVSYEEGLANYFEQEKVSGTEKLVWPKRFLTPFPRGRHADSAVATVQPNAFGDRKTDRRSGTRNGRFSRENALYSAVVGLGEEKVSGTEKLILPKRFLTPFLR